MLMVVVVWETETDVVPAEVDWERFELVIELENGLFEEGRICESERGG